MPKLLVFDWDGTLCDSVSTILCAKGAVAKAFNQQAPSQDLAKSALGLGLNNAFKRCFPKANTTQRSAMIDAFKQLMQQQNYCSRLFPNTHTMLKQLLQKNYRLAIATAKSRTGLDKSIQDNDCGHYFSATLTAEETRSKPDPLMLEQLMHQFQVTRQQTLMIGDSLHDIEMAKRAKVRSVGVSFGAKSQAELATLNPLCIIDQWPELITLLDTL